MSKDLTIGEAVKAVDLSVDAVRFYERQGIMAPPPRMADGRRAYGPQQMVELTFIARGRAVRMPLSEIGRYLSLARQGEATLPERMRIMTAHAEHGIDYVAAPMFGRPEAAAAGKLNILTAVPPDAIERVRPLFEAMSSRIWPLGVAPAWPRSRAIS
jgi:DNA-binding transcriptional MerR regulator